MAAIHTLLPDRRYRVVREFVGHAQCLHSLGETWEFVGTNLVPYHDGLMLHVLAQGLLLAYRLWAVPEEQVAVITHFTDYVVPC